MDNNLLAEALAEVLVCPLCHGDLNMDFPGERISCQSCGRKYPLEDGIPILLPELNVAQQEERKFRDELAKEWYHWDKDNLSKVVAKHHCLPVMKDRADRFRSQLSEHDWILDVGIGFGWHWAGNKIGGKIIGIDFCYGNLKIAQKMLSVEDRVCLVCADATHLPVKNNSISGCWSVQTFQHFPENVLKLAKGELQRVLKRQFLMEVYDLNPALLLRIIYRLFGHQLHISGKTGSMELYRRSAAELRKLWQFLVNETVKVDIGYSELFFHPDLRVKPNPYPMAIERLVAKFPGFASLFARQIYVKAAINL